MIDIFLWAAGIIATGLFSLIGWVFKMIFDRIHAHGVAHNNLETRFDAHRLYAAETYTTKNDIKAMKDELTAQLSRIEDKLDRKVDK